MSANFKLSNSGLYRLSAQSGLLTGVAAGTATAGHLFCFRWTSATVAAYIHRLKVRWQTLTAFTAAQEIAFRAFRLTGYSAAHTGGNPVALGSPNSKKATRFGVTAASSAIIGGTGALTAGTHTLDSTEFFGLNGWSQAGATVDDVNVESTVDNGSFCTFLIELRANEGIVVRNEILMGAAGVGRLLVEMDWSEANI